MHRRWLVFMVLLGGVGAAGYWAAVALGLWTTTSQAQARPVPEGDQEIAWIAPATSGDAWERLVAALKLLQQEWPTLHDGAALEIHLDKAFLDLTADVPEVAVGFGAGRLWIRWYKLSGDADSQQWITHFRQRGTAPLAVLGGDTSDRALALALALRACQGQWPAAAPLFLITTATAERYFPKDDPNAHLTNHEEWPKLLDVYPGRSFRFSFTNTRMVRAVLDFVKQTPQVWPQKIHDPATFSGVVAADNAWTSLGLLAAAGHLQPYYLYTLAWGDDGYSKDLREIFSKQFAEATRPINGRDDLINVADAPIPYSAGDQYQANPREHLAATAFLANRGFLDDRHHLLVLPTGAQRARRFLRTLCQRAPLEMRNVVVVNGDAISFNTIYRDRDVAWNILDVPVPLVFFSHRNPTDQSAGFDPARAATGTQDLLLYRDLLEAAVHAAFDQGQVVSDTDAVRDRLRRLRWRFPHVYAPEAKAAEVGRPFFDADGNRSVRTGEHIVWLKPAFEPTRNLPQATITVWHVSDAGWRLTGQPLDVFYNRANTDALAGE